MVEGDRRDTVFLRFLAIVLITNSHLDLIYPLPRLATGGALGNSLFFMLSGYGLALSEMKGKRRFLSWYRRRVARIYPSLFLVIVVFHLVAAGEWKTWRWQDYVTGFVWPTPFWFVSVLMIFYLIFFAFMKADRPELYLAGMALLGVLYLGVYLVRLDLTSYTIEGAGSFKAIFYLQAMLLGGYLARTGRHRVKGKGVHLIVLVLLLAAYYAFLLAMGRGHLVRYQLVVHILTLPMLYLSLSLSGSRFVKEGIMSRPWLAPFVTLTGGLTLELYLLQDRFHSSPYVLSLPFPLSLGAFCLALFTCAFVTRAFSGAVRQRLSGRPKIDGR